MVSRFPGYPGYPARIFGVYRFRMAAQHQWPRVNLVSDCDEVPRTFWASIILRRKIRCSAWNPALKRVSAGPAYFTETP